MRKSEAMLETELHRVKDRWNTEHTWETTPGHGIHIADQPADSARHLVEERYDWQQIGQRFVDLVESVVESRV